MNNEELFTLTGVTKSNRVLYTPSEFARKYLLYAQEIGYLSSLKPHVCKREKLDSYLIMIVLEGCGKLTVEDTEYCLNKGDIAFIDCMKSYEHISNFENSWSLGWVHFNGFQASGYFELFLQHNDNRNVFTPIDISKYNEIFERVRVSQEDFTVRGECKAGLEILRLLNLIVEESEKKGKMEKQAERETMKSIREAICSNYYDKDIINRIKGKYKDITNLEDLFISFFGISMEEYLLSRRINSAKELLRFSVRPVSEIAKVCGIENESDMEELFMKYEHVSVDEYRGKWAGWIRS